jgi:hypothetical protein
MNSNVIIWNYVFHFSEYTNIWYAIHRDKYLDYWSAEKDVFLSDENLDELIKKIKDNDRATTTTHRND